MPVKIRLQRHGRKGQPYFHIVAADARSPRDGKYIERLGFYNPNTNPATIEIDVDSAVKWLRNGAETTDTARAILSYKGALYKNHLMKGVEKGAFSEEDAQKRFESWLQEKQDKIDAKKKGLADSSAKEQKEKLAAEKEVNKARQAEIAAANAPEVAEEEAPQEAAAEAAEEVAEKEEAPVEEKAPQAAAAEAAEEVAPAKEEEKSEEEPKAEKPAEEEKKEESSSEEEKK